MKCALVIVTLSRSAVLASTLAACLRQTRKPDGVFVVDNGSNDDTLEMLARDFPAVRVIESGDNVGVNAGLAIGMRAAFGAGFEAFWLMDDDSEPPPDALEELVAVLESHPQLDGIGYQGGTLRAGLIRHAKTPAQIARLDPIGDGADRLFRVDFFLVDGGLITRRAVERVGYPPEDYFMMIGDIEYPYRMTRAGLTLAVFERDRMQRATLGGIGDGPVKPAWRTYYKARNQVRMAITYRSPALMLGALARMARLFVVHARKGEGARARAIVRGVVDGFAGRMGRTVEPSGP